MAPQYFSQAWVSAAVKAFNDDTDSADALKGWRGDVGLVAGDVGVWLEQPQGSALVEPVLMTAEALEAKKPASCARASMATWQALIEGTLDPIAAVVQNKLSLQGDVQQIISRLTYRGLAQRWLLSIRAEV